MPEGLEERIQYGMIGFGAPHSVPARVAAIFPANPSSFPARTDTKKIPDARHTALQSSLKSGSCAGG